MRAVGTFLGLIILVAVGVYFRWPLDTLQLAFIGAALVLEGVIIWAYFASPSAKAERP